MSTPANTPEKKRRATPNAPAAPNSAPPAAPPKDFSNPLVRLQASLEPFIFSVEKPRHAKTEDRIVQKAVSQALRYVWDACEIAIKTKA